MSTPMTSRTDEDGSRPWPTRIKAIHWLAAFAVCVEVPAGYLMSYTYAASFRDKEVLSLHLLLSQIHHTLGLLLLVTGLAWMAIRLRSVRPAFPAAMSTAQRWLARGAHALLLAMLVLIPWSGWTAISSLQDSAEYGVTHRWFFGFDRLLPRIWMPMDGMDPHGYSRFAHLHRLFLTIGAVVLVLHLCSTLWHHLIRRDSILARMWPLGRP